MSIKIEGGEGTEENVIKAGASNELLYNDKEVLLKENFDLDLELLPPDLTKTQEWTLMDLAADEVNVNPFTVPEDGWIVKVAFSNEAVSAFIKIDGFGGVGITPSQETLGTFAEGEYLRGTITIFNLNCPYPVKKGQVVEVVEDEKNTVIITFAPCKGL